MPGLISIIFSIIIGLSSSARPEVTAPLLLPSNGTIPPLGVMIDNEFNAWPFQKGLSHAKVVYGAPAEGGVTRFLAIFAPGDIPEKVGPVRSARSYFLDWMHEYNGVYAHVGGHGDALERLRKENIFDADQFFNEAYFHRENVGRTQLEHTMFLSRKEFEGLLAEKKWAWTMPPHLSDVRLPFPIELTQLPSAQKITINLGTKTYAAQYHYDPIRGVYLRTRAGQPHIDSENGQQLAPGVVVVQKVKTWGNNDDKFSISMQTIGEGEAVVFMGGRVIKGAWQKTSLDEPTRFFDAGHRELVFAATPLWIEVLPAANTLSYE